MVRVGGPGRDVAVGEVERWWCGGPEFGECSWIVDAETVEGDLGVVSKGFLLA